MNMRVNEADTGNAPGDVIRTAVLRIVQERAKDVQNLVETLALRLQDELVKSAADTGSADMPGDDEFPSLVRGMPLFDPGTIRVTVPKSSYTALLGRRFEEEHLVRHIRQQVGGSFELRLPVIAES